MKHRESHIQQACVRWFRYQFPDLRDMLFAIPNGGGRGRTEAAIMKGEGVTPGVSDLILLTARGGYGALCIEMKAETGRLSENQKNWLAASERAGNKCVVCWSVEDFIREVNEYINGQRSIL